MTAPALIDLSQRVAAMRGFGDNALDVLIEIALFEPDSAYVSVRANAAGTKVIFTDASGDEHTHWPFDWTMERERPATIERLRLSSPLPPRVIRKLEGAR